MPFVHCPAVLWQALLLLAAFHATHSSGAAGASPTAEHGSKGLSSSSPRVFIADIGPQYNVWLVHALAGLGPDDPGDIATLLSNPLGQPLDMSKPQGLRQHYYYALDVWIHQQLLRSPLLVQRPEQADIIFLPLYLGVAQKLLNDFQHKETVLLLSNFWDLYHKSETYQCSKPHWLALADIEVAYQAGCGGWGFNFLCQQEQQLPPALIVSSPEMFLETKPRPFEGSAPAAATVAVPYLSHVHLTRGSVRLRHPFNASEVKACKRHLAMQAFNDKTAVRKQLKAECLARKVPECQHIGPTSESRTSFPYGRIQQAAKESWFCIQPAGDTPTRAATFDCILAGAIPVFFDPIMIELLPFGDKIPWQEIVVIQPEPNQGVASLELLSEISLDARMERLRLLHNAKHILQYSSDPDHHQIQFSQRNQHTPQDDAFTSMFKGVLQKACSRHLLKGRC